MARPIQVRIDQSAMENNLQVARRTTTSRLMSVIKANGYGHGLLHAAEAFAATDGYALLDIQDAIRLREAGFRQPILLLEGFFGEDELPVIAEHDLTCVIHGTWQLAMLQMFSCAVLRCRTKYINWISDKTVVTCDKLTDLTIGPIIIGIVSKGSSTH